jgi:hypothetical protein
MRLARFSPRVQVSAVQISCYASVHAWRVAFVILSFSRNIARVLIGENLGNV